MTDVEAFLTEWTNAELKGDGAALDAMLTDDFFGVGPLGFILPKPAWIQRHAPDSGLSYETFELNEVQTHVHGDAAIITARQDAQGSYQGNPTPEAIRATLTLVRDGEQAPWQMAAIHMSFIAGTPGAPPIPGPPQPNRP